MGRLRLILLRAACACALVCGITASSAVADAWFPHPANAQWTYFWKDNNVNPQGTTESVSVDTTDQVSCGWQLQWTGTIEIPLGGSIGSGTPLLAQQPDNGTACFLDQSNGLVNTDWSGSAPPINEPSLCPAGTTSCPNSLGSVLFNVIWGSRSPVVAEPLLRGTAWNGTGGASGNVTSQNTYLGLQTVKVPAFPDGIPAAAVQSTIALAGTPGDAYGSGIRTTWWVYGVGPVKVVFNHDDGSVTTAVLTATNLTAGQAPADQNYFPLKAGMTGTYQWTNRKHLRQPEIEKVSVARGSGTTAEVTARSVSGPIRAAGNYLFSLSLGGLINTYGSTAGATLARLPKLARNVHFFTPVDLMTYGFNPLLPAYPSTGAGWGSGNARDFQVYGVKGSSHIVGVRRVRVPAGTFQALEVRSVLTQRGHPFGSGVRTMWFSPTKGLVKLVFQHRDGSVSTVELLKK